MFLILHIFCKYIQFYVLFQINSLIYVNLIEFNWLLFFSRFYSMRCIENKKMKKKKQIIHIATVNSKRQTYWEYGCPSIALAFYDFCQWFCRVNSRLDNITAAYIFFYFLVYNRQNPSVKNRITLLLMRKIVCCTPMWHICHGS